jgi:uncharacterized membrane protein
MVDVARTRLNATAVLGLCAVIGMGLGAFPLAQFVTVVGVLVVCGLAVSPHVVPRPANRLIRVLVIVGGGLFTMLAVDGVVGYLGRFVGVSRPFDRVPQLIIWALIIGVLTVRFVRRGVDPLGDLLVSVSRREWMWWALAGVPGALALIGVIELNNNRDAWIASVVGLFAIAMCVIAVLLPTHAAKGPSRIVLLTSALLTVSWQMPLRGRWMTGWDIQHEYYVATSTIARGRLPLPVPRGFTSDPYASMLSLTSWPAQLHALTGLSVRTILIVVPTLALVVALWATWSSVTAWVSGRVAAAICAVLILGSAEMVRYLSSVTRECYALLFFTLLVLAITSPRLDIKAARRLATLAGLGIVLTHYTTAFITSGMIVVAWIFAVAWRSPKATRVVTAPVAWTIAASTVVWEVLVANTTSNFSNVLSALQDQGLRLLPSSGSLFSRWIKGASISQLVDAKVIRAQDIHLAATRFADLPVASSAYTVPLVNNPAPAASGVRVVGPLLTISTSLIAQLAVLAVLISIVGVLWWTRRDRSLAAIGGFAAAGLIISLVCRLSQTLATFFDPARVALQMYLIFVVVIAIAIARWRPTLDSAQRSRTLRTLGLASACMAVVVATLTSTQLANFTRHGAVLPMAYANRGEAIERVPTPNDIVAASWVAHHSQAEARVQADIFAQLALYNFGFANKANFFYSVDPIIVSDAAWVFTNHSNVTIGRARGGDNSKVGVFTFPSAYFETTRSVLYASATDVVFGQNAYFASTIG